MHAEKPHDTNGVLIYRATVERPWSKHRQKRSKRHGEKGKKRQAERKQEGGKRVGKQKRGVDVGFEGREADERGVS
jgi:hypothetical protein